jgi:hypothetical protein
LRSGGTCSARMGYGFRRGVRIKRIRVESGSGSGSVVRVRGYDGSGLGARIRL